MFSSNTSAVSGDAVYIEDVFSTWLYTGNGSTQTITNGIDLAGKGGLVWIKQRDGTANHTLTDTARGNNFQLFSNSDVAQANVTTRVTAFNATGFDLGLSSAVNGSASTYASWTFREQAKFFDVVTYTGDGSSNRNISHSLGSTPGCIIVKRTNAGGNDWWVWHRSISTGNLSGNNLIRLNLTAAATSGTTDILGTASSTTFQVGFDGDVNGSGQTYVAYLFAHDAGGFGLTGTDNVISCGSYNGSGAAGNPINLGYEPQWLLIKSTLYAENWYLFDSMRGMTVGSDGTARLYANTFGAETSLGAANCVSPTATGFSFGGGSSGYNQSGETYIYIAIRRGPMKTPTTGTSVFDPEAYTGTSATRTVTSGFPVDLSASKIRSQGFPGGWFDRLRGALQVIRPELTDAEATSANSLTGFNSMTGVVLGSDPSGRINTSPETYAMWNFRRAPGFFDVVCYTGTGGFQTVSHNLGVAPELVIFKGRGSPATNWITLVSSLSKFGYLNNTLAVDNDPVTYFTTNGSTYAAPTATSLFLNNLNASTYVAYLFASCPGVSKVGSYTGTGALQTINCGFTGGARFVLIKRTDSTGDWFTYDSARGITSGNDPYLLMNSTAAEVTGTNYVDTTSVGFQVTAAAPAGLNANGGTYIFLAIA